MSVYGTRFLGEEGYPSQPSHAGPKVVEQLKQYESLRGMLSKSPGLAALWKDVQPTLDADIAELVKASHVVSN